MSSVIPKAADAQMELLITKLDSLVNGECAISMLVACGQCAIPYLEHFLLAGSPRTIAIPHCRAVRALGELGAYSVLISYFDEYESPPDAEVLFAEDGVRSAVARELMRWKSEEVFQILLSKARQRLTGGLVLALGEFRRPDCVPLLFKALEADFCREDAKNALRKIPDASRQHAFLTIRGLTGTQLHGPTALRRRRATLQLLEEFGVSPTEWRDLRSFLEDNDADVVIAAASIGSVLSREEDGAQIVRSLFRVSDHLDWLQEHQVNTLLDAHRAFAYEMARKLAEARRVHGERPKWIKPSWRILRHVLGKELEGGHYGAA
jgi:hypothetical protein